MDPELYVFPRITSPARKAAASTALFALVITAARLLLPASLRWSIVDEPLARWLSLLLGYGVFLYASIQAWRATHQKNTVEDPHREVALRLLERGFYARARHPMYGMFILANAGLGLASGSVYGLGFSLLSLVVFIANGIFEERAVLIPQFGEQYRAYMRRVPARCFAPWDAALLLATLAVTVAGAF